MKTMIKTFSKTSEVGEWELGVIAQEIPYPQTARSRLRCSMKKGGENKTWEQRLKRHQCPYRSKRASPLQTPAPPRLLGKERHSTGVVSGNKMLPQPPYY
ncbi:unnamed protein product [Eretmochelys imbricata]